MLCNPDLSKGHAACKIPVVNMVDNEDFNKKQRFIYIGANINEEGFVQKEYDGCTCVDKCLPGKCECIKKSSVKITDDHRIDLREGIPDCYNTILYECSKETCKGCKGKCAWRLTPDQFNLEMELFKTPHAGWAVRSRQCIETGTYIADFVGEVCDEKQMKDRPLDYAYNLFQLNSRSDIYIDPYFYGNITRFFNHSCFENLKSFCFLSKHRNQKRLSLGFYACRDIVFGEELTIDYGIGWWKGQIEKASQNGENFYCYCDWVYCLNPAPGKPQMEMKDALEEQKRRIGNNAKILMQFKEMEEEKKKFRQFLKNEEERAAKSERKKKMDEDDDAQRDLKEDEGME